MSVLPGKAEFITSHSIIQNVIHRQAVAEGPVGIPVPSVRSIPSIPSVRSIPSIPSVP